MILTSALSVWWRVLEGPNTITPPPIHYCISNTLRLSGLCQHSRWNLCFMNGCHDTCHFVVNMNSFICMYQMNRFPPMCCKRIMWRNVGDIIAYVFFEFNLVCNNRRGHEWLILLQSARTSSLPPCLHWCPFVAWLVCLLVTRITQKNNTDCKDGAFAK